MRIVLYEFCSPTRQILPTWKQEEFKILQTWREVEFKILQKWKLEKEFIFYTYNTLLLVYNRKWVAV